MNEDKAHFVAALIVLLAHLFWWVLNLAVLGAVVYVAAHFLAKVW